jgi:hypothetical protein
MNKVDFLLKTPFHKLSDEEKLVKQLGPGHSFFTIIQELKTQS